MSQRFLLWTVWTKINNNIYLTKIYQKLLFWLHQNSRVIFVILISQYGECIREDYFLLEKMTLSFLIIIFNNNSVEYVFKFYAFSFCNVFWQVTFVVWSFLYPSFMSMELITKKIFCWVLFNKIRIRQKYFKESAEN